MQSQSQQAKPKRKVFISYHHRNDQDYKKALLDFNEMHNIFIDSSVDIGDIDDSLPNQTIRRIIRDKYLTNSTVTILLVGTETKYRKHIDWEIYSSMIDGSVNKRSGILVITLPSTKCATFTAPHPGEKALIHPECMSWTSVKTRTEYEACYPYLPDRIIDNLLEPKAKISVVPWYKLNAGRLAYLIEAAFQARETNEYDMSREMRRSDFNPNN